MRCRFICFAMSLILVFSVNSFAAQSKRQPESKNPVGFYFIDGVKLRYGIPKNADVPTENLLMSSYGSHANPIPRSSYAHINFTYNFGDGEYFDEITEETVKRSYPGKYQHIKFNAFERGKWGDYDAIIADFQTEDMRCWQMYIHFNDDTLVIDCENYSTKANLDLVKQIVGTLSVKEDVTLQNIKDSGLSHNGRKASVIK